VTQVSDAARAGDLSANSLEDVMLEDSLLHASRFAGFILQDLQGETALYRAQRLAMGRIKALIHAT
jgi:hypothetical protein